MEQLWDWILANGELLLKGLLAFLIFCAFFLLRKKLAKLSLSLLGKCLFYRKPEIHEAFCDALFRPLAAFFVVLGTVLALILAPFPANNAWNLFLTRAFKVSVIVIVTWSLANFITLGAHLIFKFSNLDSKSNGTATKFVGNILKVATVALGALIIVSELGFDVKALVTGVGLGGLTFALAAKDSASNMFGGFIIILDKPFVVGDWITTPTVDGVVEDITVRSTRIRTFANSLIVVPNSTLANEAITNWSRMNKRRVKCAVGLTYDTPKDTLARVIERIDSAIRETDGVDAETIMVTFDEFSASSLDIGILFFTQTIVWDEYMKIKEQVNYKIKSIVEQEGAAFAFPSHSIYVEQLPSHRSPEQ